MIFELFYLFKGTDSKLFYLFTLFTFKRKKLTTLAGNNLKSYLINQYLQLFVKNHLLPNHQLNHKE